MLAWQQCPPGKQMKITQRFHFNWRLKSLQTQKSLSNWRLRLISQRPKTKLILPPTLSLELCNHASLRTVSGYQTLLCMTFRAPQTCLFQWTLAQMVLISSWVMVVVIRPKERIIKWNTAASSTPQHHQAPFPIYVQIILYRRLWIIRLLSMQVWMKV